ncbi:MAG: twitching motility protein PilT [Rhodoglobus sp.]|nr:twitching motility protein PilT [Rhodoglobus sp.]
MSTVLLDTSVIIDPTGLDAWRDSIALVSAVTLGELHAGLDTADIVARAERRRRLNHARATYQAIPFGEAQAELYGLLVSLTIEAGRSHRQRALDLQIAATAAVAGVPLLTRNAADLVGLERVVKVVSV